MTDYFTIFIINLYIINCAIFSNLFLVQVHIFFIEVSTGLHFASQKKVVLQPANNNVGKNKDPI